ncbi:MULTISPECIES: hypothetical protein [unclassified Streptomyces]|uniref:hypothetical protein n=1 Tax=unclassified Streptomyces TaxID=2593676 RepID=UPI000DADBE4A|nr:MULTISPECIES: hypothetical protein [unclassified Streptomyces]PZT74416.1 hypothetical protein DNK55_20120 [Streptomyces sp. AC1-42T]PZT82596.1 hypothetical protein DNK56_11325 [Streptomyces sp. AC1-42W]
MVVQRLDADPGEQAEGLGRAMVREVGGRLAEAAGIVGGRATGPWVLPGFAAAAPLAWTGIKRSCACGATSRNKAPRGHSRYVNYPALRGRAWR